MEYAATVTIPDLPASSGASFRYAPVPGDNSAAFSAFLAGAKAAGIYRVSAGSGRIEFASKPTIPSGMWIEGDGSRITQLVRTYSGDFIEFAGGFGGGLSGMSLQAGAGTSGGKGLSLKSSATTSPDYARFSDLIVTNDQNGGGGVWDWPMHLDGSLRSTPQGLRDLHFSNVNLFAGTLGALNIINGVGLKFFDVNAYPAGGTSAKVAVGGGSDTIDFFGCCVLGELNLTNLQKLNFFGHINSLNSAGTASKCYIVGSQSGGPIVNNLTSSAVGLV